MKVMQLELRVFMMVPQFKFLLGTVENSGFFFFYTLPQLPRGTIFFGLFFQDSKVLKVSSGTCWQNSAI